MWICPKCGCVLTHQKPYACAGKVESVDAYLMLQSEASMPRLVKLRALLKDVLPETTECISWGDADL